MWLSFIVNRYMGELTRPYRPQTGVKISQGSSLFVLHKKTLSLQRNQKRKYERLPIRIHCQPDDIRTREANGRAVPHTHQPAGIQQEHHRPDKADVRRQGLWQDAGRNHRVGKHPPDRQDQHEPHRLFPPEPVPLRRKRLGSAGDGVRCGERGEAHLRLHGRFQKCTSL